ncbi:MAG TPA: SDR family oxidoreductase [Thermoanaerobaculia bacterium]|nr:SDR family oxidoreductase [Thermoanaerobaculia bacterium]
MDLATAKALVTGGSSGIGLETARQLGQRGARVAICGRDASRLRRAADEIGALAIQGDVGNEEDAARMVREVIDAFGDYDVLINNAGYGHFAPLVDTSLDDMRRLYATNVFGATLMARESARHFIAKQRGNIVNVASTAGQRGFAGGTAYSSSKFALSGLTECWRAELRTHNVRVMQINPSEVQTEFVVASGRAARAYSERKLQAIDIAHAILSMLAMHDRGFTTETTVWATNPD